MKKRVSTTVLACLLAVLLVGIPVYAAASATITIVESSGNPYDMIGATASMDNAYLASHGFISTTGLDVDLNSLPFMLADDRTIVATPIVANSSTLIPYTTGNTPSSTFRRLLTGYGGYITVHDAVNLELGDSFEVEVKGYIDTDYVAGKNIVYKASAFKLYISAEGTLQAEITGGATVTAAGTDPGPHTVRVKADGINLEIYVDDMVTPKHSQPIGVAVPDEATDWLLFQNNVMPYVEYIKISVGA